MNIEKLKTEKLKTEKLNIEKLNTNIWNIDKLADAIGLIDDAKIQDEEKAGIYGFDRSRNRYKYRWKKAAAWAAGIALCLAVSATALAAADFDPVYRMIFSISPSAAQRLKPVKLSCEDNGIKMEVQSAEVSGSEANIVVSMEDLEGNRIDETTDLFDSYSINRAFDCTASCASLDYDKETGRALFLIHINQWGGHAVGGDKITFSVKRFLSSKQQFEGALPELDLAGAERAGETRRLTRILESLRGGSGEGFDGTSEEFASQDCLIPAEGGIYSPVEGMRVTAMGFVDDQLHIQLYFEDILETDNHGYIRLVDPEGNEAQSYSYSFWDDEQKGSYQEIVYSVSPDEIRNYQAYGTFVTSKGAVEGNWQVTFPLEK